MAGSTSDSYFFYSITSIFLVCGIFLSLIGEEFGGQDYTDQITDIQGGLSDEVGLGFLDYISIALTIGSMFIWTFGAIPFFVEVIVFLPLRIYWFYLIARLIRGGG